MTKKWPLFTGIALLILGIFLRAATSFDSLGLGVLLLGVAFKIYYFAEKLIRKEYKPGYEFMLLLIGLTLFLGGIFLNKHGIIENPSPLKISGISLKVAFVFMFIRKTRN